MFYIDSASFDNLQLSGSLIGTLSASFNLANTTLTASIVSASNISGSALNSKGQITYARTDAYTVTASNQTDEIAHFYTLPANYLKVGDFIIFNWEATTGETTALAKQYKPWISTTSSSVAGATQWGLVSLTQNNVSLQMTKYGYITSNTAMKILGTSTTATTNPGVVLAAPTEVTVPDITSSWNVILTANRSGSDTTRVEWSYLQIWKF